MSTASIRRPLVRAPARRRLGEAVAALLAAGTAAAATWVMVALDSQGALRGIAFGLLAAVVLWFATTRRTPLALALFMVYVGALDGYLKLSTGSAVVTLVRDVLLFAIAAGALVRAQVTGVRLKAPPFSVWVAAFAVLVLVQLANPGAGTFAHSLAGVRQHLEFVPLFFLTFAFVRTTRALRVFVVLIVLIASANGIASWVQFRLTPQQFAAWGPGYAERVLGEGRFSESGRTFASNDDTTATRPFGLGSDAGSGGFAAALALGGVLALASRFARLRALLFAVAMAIGATTAIVTSQGRGAVVAGVIVVATFGVLAATHRGRLASLVGVGVALIVGLVVVQGIVGSVGSSALRYDGLTASRIVETTDKARGDTLLAIPRNVVDHPLGAGLGTAGPASGTAGANDLVGAVNAESELSFLVLETGIGGALVLTAFPVLLFALGVSRIRHEPDREARVLLAAVIAPLAGILALYPIGGGLTATTPMGPYLWAVGGIVSYWLVARQRR